ncbi:hypothetical protein VitviT2T_010479 [Vitis vinifera]|uniref:PGG domain-containing protein n=2 Tax=Vitis vinifera TaxID=29760 RepID=A0ABY9C9H4_VITVI|nr:hypothetical protein VitviT2T_010479 [Vitis vinifera]
MEGKWDKVVKIYQDVPWASKEKITTSGETALHIAISDCKEDVVEKLLETVIGISADVLRIQNAKGNTPLHLAASIGNVSMCRTIAGRYPEALRVRNEELETPLFLAARHGKIKVFFCLLEASTVARIERENYLPYRNKKSETVLHCAITGGHFKLAFLIIQLYEDLVNLIDEKGFSPLHLLADKPTAFRSGTKLSLMDKIIYPCIFVPDFYHPLISGDDKNSQNQTHDKYKRETQEVSRTSTKNQPTAKAENRQQHIEEGQCSIRVGMKEEGMMLGRQYPPNYDTCFNFIKLLIKAMLSILVLGLGPNYRDKIRKKKESNIWAAKVMNILLEKTKRYEYDTTGKNPRYEERQMPYGTKKEEEKEKTQDSDTLLPPQIPDEGKFSTQNEEGIEKIQVSLTILPCKRLEEGTSKTNRGQQERSEEDPNWALLLRIGKAGLSADPIIVAGKAAKKLDDKLHELDLETKKKNEEVERLPTPILMAAKNGISEMVESILNFHPKAIHDIDSEKKNLVLLAVENRHPHVFQLLLKKKILKDTVFGAVDNNGNSALHLAAMFRGDHPWPIPGAALQMQWEVKWYQYVKQSMPPNFFPIHNKKKESAKQIFTREHQDLVKMGGEWLTSTATSCSVVATLIATVAFATSTAVPGGTKEGSGKPILEQQPAFHIFAISSLIALCFSVTSTVMFLAILTSRRQEKDFAQDLPRKLLLGLTSLFISILSILVTFCASHFFVLRDEFRIAALPVYAVTCLPATFFAVAQLPLYLDLIWATFSKVPQACLDDT